MTTRKPLMAGNWKMNLNHIEAIALVQKLAFSLNSDDFDAVDVAVIPPFTDIRSIESLVHGDGLRLQYGAQDVSAKDSGAYTGEISGAMLAKLGCTYAVVGHSERRQYHAESDAVVNAKTKAAIRHNLVPIVCVGEPLDIRKAGNQVQYTLDQTAGSLADLTAAEVGALVIAYEPSGPSAPAKLPPRRMHRKSAKPFACGSRTPMAIRQPNPFASSTAEASRPAMLRASWRSRMSTVPSLVAPHSMPTNSWQSPGSACTRQPPDA